MARHHHHYSGYQLHHSHDPDNPPNGYHNHQYSPACALNHYNDHVDTGRTLITTPDHDYQPPAEPDPAAA
jgi:hypothetical protein